MLRALQCGLVPAVWYANITADLQKNYRGHLAGLSADAGQLARDLTFFKERATVLAPAQKKAARHLAATAKPALFLHFTGGYASFAEHALPLIAKLALPAAVHLPAVLPETASGLFWWDEVALFCHHLSGDRFFREAFTPFFLADSKLSYALHDGILPLIDAAIHYLAQQEEVDRQGFLAFCRDSFGDVTQKLPEDAAALRPLALASLEKIIEKSGATGVTVVQAEAGCLLPGPAGNGFFARPGMSEADLKERIFLPAFAHARHRLPRIKKDIAFASGKIGLAARLAAPSIRDSLAPPKPRHVFVSICDHYEPYWRFATHREAKKRVEQWHSLLPEVFAPLRDADNRPPVYSFFYPEEEYRPDLLHLLAELCADGHGEMEVHIHHDSDTSAGIRKTLLGFTRRLYEQHGLLSTDGQGRINYGFIHGNWALDNSRKGGRWCGVNDEITVLAETGCHADFTMPSGRHLTQTRTINSIYYAIDDPEKPKSHDTGIAARAGVKAPATGLLCIQGPLILRREGLAIKVDSSALAHYSVVTRPRADAWLSCRVHVAGRPDWVFVKLHTHGTQGPTSELFFKHGMLRNTFLMLQDACAQAGADLHFLSAREMSNVVHAIEAGHDQWRPELADFRYRLFTPSPRQTATATP